MRQLVVCLVLFVPFSSCLQECQRGGFACAKGGKCIEQHERCDLVTDCPDGSDEVDCDMPCRNPHMQQCDNGHCIATFFNCDGHNDCGDWSDELNCTSKIVSDVGILDSSCEKDYFRCQDSMCIPKKWVCDGAVDCNDGLDERNCTAETPVCHNGFLCGKECIMKEWVCDGVSDCFDGTDEHECGPDGHHQCLPEHGWFACSSKGAAKCMPISRACDGYDDCDDRSDEGGLCASPLTCGNTTNCLYGCHKTPTGSVCSCPTGFKVNGTKCVDIDECNVSPPACSQDCSNTRGAYQCSCVAGYKLHMDNHSCTAYGPEAVLLITTATEVRSLSLVSQEFDIIQSGKVQLQSVATDVHDRTVFWAEKDSDKSGIFKAILDGSDHERIVSVGLELVEDLAIDWVGEHIYFTDSGRQHIVACDTHGTICTIVMSNGLEKPKAISVYPEKRLMFWTDLGAQPYIGSAGMDGSNQKKIVTTDIIMPSGLVVDETVHRIFWCDGKLNRIESSRIDGSDRFVVPLELSNPYSLDVFENRIYWTDPVGHEVHSSEKFSGKNHTILLKEGSQRFSGIRINHPSKQRHMMSPCWNIICSHLCLLSPSNSGFKCACPAGMELNVDNRTCRQTEISPSSVIIATFKDLYQMTHHQIGKESVESLSLRNVENIGALVSNPLGHSAIYSDINAKVIYSLHLTTFRQTVLFDQVGSVEGLDVDPFTENLFWSDVEQGTLSVGNIGSGQRVVLARDLSSPKEIALAPEWGLLFMVEGRISHAISVWQMDGSQRRELIRVFGTVSSMVYNNKYLYFSDSIRGTIERIDIDGQNRLSLRSHLGSPIAIGVSVDSVFWLTLYSSRINWFEKSEPKTSHGFIMDSDDGYSIEYRKLAVVEHFNSSQEHVCLGHTGGCSHLCVPTPQGATCLCPTGMEMAPNKRLCQPLQSTPKPATESPSITTTTAPRDIGCTVMQFSCETGGCISADFYCDGEFDCHDESDEPATCPPVQCGRDEFRCSDGRECIANSQRCDGHVNCRDGSDEPSDCSTQVRDDSAHCAASQFYCSLSRLCIPQVWVCDEDRDCEHGEDEGDCYSAIITCPLNYVLCPSHYDCVPRLSLCSDGAMADCASLSDAQLCANLNKTGSGLDPTSAFLQPKESCDSNQFTCYLGTDECIPMSERCNCDFNCRYGEDEEGCAPCQDGQFRCPGEMRYINTSWVCDGFADCSSGADELPELCKSGSQTEEDLVRGRMISEFQFCSDSEYKCRDGKCIPLDYVCDLTRNCDDGSDEGGNCSTSCIDNGHCPQVCFEGPEGPRCGCNHGFTSVNHGHLCEDIDECQVSDPCSQLCTNTKGSYECSCVAGYELEADQSTCKVVEGRPFWLISSAHHVDTMFNTRDLNQLIYSAQTIKDIAFSNKDSTLYSVTSEGVSWTSTLRSNTSLLYKLSQISPSGLALDDITGNIYVSGVMDSDTAHDRSVIRVYSPAASADVTIVETATLITDLVVDVRQGYLFWSEHVKPHTGRLYRSAMDGTLALWLHGIEKVVYPVGLAFDTIKSRIYWADLRLQSISSSDYDGRRQRVVVSNTNGLPLSISFFENQVSWSNVNEKKIFTQHLNGNGLVSNSLDRVSHILAAHSVLDSQSANPCASSPCGNGLCLLKNSQQFNCFCPMGAGVLSLNPFRCSDRINGSNEDESGAGHRVSVVAILICLSVLTLLAIFGWAYYNRWQRTIGSPLKFRFRNAFGLAEESTAWEESVDYSDSKMLFPRDDHDSESHHVDMDNSQLEQSDYASLKKTKWEGHTPRQFLTPCDSMKENLLE